MALDVEALARRGERIGRARNLTKAEVYVVDEGGRSLVVKTVAGRPALTRLLLAGALLRREGRVLAKLRGTLGVPKLIEATDTALVVEWRPGRTLFDLRKKGVSPATAAGIEAVVAAVHARGFAHGDIGRRDVLVSRDGTISLLDFATAVGPGFPPLLGRLFFPIWRRSDVGRIAKMLRRYRIRWDARQVAKAAKITQTPTTP